MGFALSRLTFADNGRSAVYWAAFMGVVRAYCIARGMSAVEADLAALNACARQELARRGVARPISGA